MPSPTPRGYRDRTGQVTYTLVERHSSVSPVEDFEVNRELMRHTLEQARQHQDQEDESEDEDEQDHEDQDVQLPDEDDGLLHEDVDEGHSHQLEDPENGEDELDVLGIPAAQVDGTVEEVDMFNEPPFDATGLKDIGNLASWTISTFKPGCGVEELRNDDNRLFWQSDGPQPHHLNIHFTRMVSIRAIRLYLDFEADESYTPTRIIMLGGTGYHDLIPFSTLTFQQPKGWINVDLKDVGGGPDRNTLRAFLIQVKIVENHQNGKDTHLRGLKIYAADEKAGQSSMGAFDGLFTAEDFGMESGGKKESESGKPPRPGRKVKFSSSMFTEPSWMKEPELR